LKDEELKNEESIEERKEIEDITSKHKHREEDSVILSKF
jgi:hypothetical protein